MEKFKNSSHKFKNNKKYTNRIKVLGTSVIKRNWHMCLQVFQSEFWNMTPQLIVDNYVEIGDFFFWSTFFRTLQEKNHDFFCKTTFIFEKLSTKIMSTGFSIFAMV